jgi:peptidoglycan/LPS O-acetylase OafA/YrhL
MQNSRGSPTSGRAHQQVYGYLPALDGLRAVSILLVVLSHLGLDRVLPGAFGVTLFFFISGYLITRQLLGSLNSTGHLDFAGFYLRRALRLMPAGITYVVVAGMAFQLAGGAIPPAGWVAALLYGSNYYDLWAGYHSLLPGVRHPFNILWSLAVEEHFYIVWPVLLLVLHRGRATIPAVLAICAAVLLWRLSLLHLCFTPGAPGVCAPPVPNPLWRYNRLYLPTDARLDSIAWGALLALLQARPAGAAKPPPAWFHWYSFALLATSFALTDPLGRYVLRPTVQGIALLGIVPWLIERESPLRHVLCWRPALLLGRLSYSLYLWHWGALGVADYVAPAGGMTWLLIAVPLSLTLATASYLGIERPMLRLRRRFGSHAPLTVSASPPAVQQSGVDIAIPADGAPHAAG